MSLQLLFATSCLCAYYDTTGDILFLDWQGRMTLSEVQVASVQLAQLSLVRGYRRVLVSTQQVKCTGYGASSWLVRTLLPGLHLGGVAQLAWVCNGAPHTITLANRFLTQLPPLQANLFTDVEHAVVWLQSQPGTLAGPERETLLAEDLARRRRMVAVLSWRVLMALARHPLWLAMEAA